LNERRYLVNDGDDVALWCSVTLIETSSQIADICFQESCRVNDAIDGSLLLLLGVNRLYRKC